MPNVPSAVTACLSVSWQVHGPFLLPTSRAAEDRWWFCPESAVLKALLFLHSMSSSALASTAENYKWLILPVGAHFASFTSPYLVIFNQHTVKYIPKWREHTDGSKGFQGHCHQYVNSRLYLAQGAQQSLSRVAVRGTSELHCVTVNIDPSRVGAPPAGQ